MTGASLLGWRVVSSIPVDGDDAAVVCDREKFDEVSEKILFFANNQLQPETSEGLTETCLGDNKTFEWVEGYTKECIKGIAGGGIPCGVIYHFLFED